MLTRLVHRLPRGDQGITLAELLVAMGLSMIIGTMATMFFVGANRAGNVSLASNQGLGEARVTLDNWTSLIRVTGWLDPTAKTDRFEEITPTKIVFWANIGNRNATDASTAALTKVALLLDVTDATSGTGRLVQIVFGADNTTPASVRQLATQAGPTNGAWIFTPYNEVGGAVDTSQKLCVQSGVPVQGLCAQAPSGAGMLDPTIAPGGLSVRSGPLTADGSGDATLGTVARIDIAFTLHGAADITTTDFASSASVNSGFPS